MKRFLLTIAFLLSFNPYLFASGGLDANTSALLHLDGTNGSTTITDNSFNQVVFTTHGDAQISTAQSKFGGASGTCDGSGDYIDATDNNLWDFFGSNSDNWTIDLFVRFAVLNTDQVIVAQSQDNGSNFFWIIKDASAPIRTVIFVGGVRVVNDLSTGVNPSANTWYHVAFIKVGTSYGLYLDGVQKDYQTSSSTGTLAGPLRLCTDTGARFFTNGFIDEFHFQHSNYFGAAPNVGKTDTVVVPTVAYSYATTPSMYGVKISGKSP